MYCFPEFSFWASHAVLENIYCTVVLYSIMQRRLGSSLNGLSRLDLFVVLRSITLGFH